MTTTRAALHLLTLRWNDLTNSLGTPTAGAWYGTGIRSQLADTRDPHEVLLAERDAAALRALERDPAQIGARPIPLRLDIVTAMDAITDTMRYCADVVAGSVQRAPMTVAPAGLTLTAGELARRRELAAADARDVRRWPIGTTTRSLESAVGWLTARVLAAPGPFRELGPGDHAAICGSTRSAIWIAEQALDRGVHATLALALPCPRCGGQVTMRGAAASCGGCRAAWTTAGEVAAA
ncbi:hypothetical protein HHX38_08480 [Streptomyces sp. PKU-MA01144]|uniref:hypothetical protein n=1 Tax=Streptomyces sp. PKU-MA01144 TaxID=2729138 RepID=UPI00147B7D46|nr:hypothetical protein [Streptomyces sp. PKU-MA01144]NNJ04169.1 hypothetical protein [Streptomyces sp. PKU-MA01144]